MGCGSSNPISRVTPEALEAVGGEIFKVHKDFSNLEHLECRLAARLVGTSGYALVKDGDKCALPGGTCRQGDNSYRQALKRVLGKTQYRGVDEGSKLIAIICTSYPVPLTVGGVVDWYSRISTNCVVCLLFVADKIVDDPGALDSVHTVCSSHVVQKQLVALEEYDRLAKRPEA